MKKKSRPAVSARTAEEINRFWEAFYRTTVIHTTALDDQWDKTVDLLRRLAAGEWSPVSTAEGERVNNYSKMVAEELMRAIRSDDTREAVIWGMRMGHLFRYAFDEVDGPFAAVGRQVVEGGRAGAEAAHPENPKRNQEMQARVDLLMGADAKLPYEKAAMQVADEFEVSLKTVKNHTNNPRPRKKKFRQDLPPA